MPHAPLILVVEDNRDVRALIAAFLEEQGFRIALTNERSVGEIILRAARPALLIADVVLRGGNGSDLAALARSTGVPVLLISGEPRSMERLEGGAVPFLQKPFRMNELAREVERLLKP